MPEMDGRQALRAVRPLEEAAGVDESEGVKVIMITLMTDPHNVLGAYREGCEAYIVKPVEKSELLEEMDKLGLSVKTA